MQWEAYFLLGLDSVSIHCKPFLRRLLLPPYRVWVAGRVSFLSNNYNQTTIQLVILSQRIVLQVVCVCVWGVQPHRFESKYNTKLFRHKKIIAGTIFFLCNSERINAIWFLLVEDKLWKWMRRHIEPNSSLFLCVLMLQFDSEWLSAYGLDYTPNRWMRHTIHSFFLF